MPPTPLPEALRAHLAVSFDLLSPLGEGGMGVVWLARDRLLDREVAIKVLRAETADDPESARRFLQEARLAARLQHPGVVPLLTFGEVEGTRFYVMPYVRGETLADRIARGPMPEPEVRRIVAEVAEALAYVHAQGIVHRDVKPANILIEAGTGRVVLADFGIARGTDGATSLTATGMVVGTPLYLAPEQAMGGAERVDGRADLYALGVVAWEALVGASPFAGLTPQEVMGRKVSGGVPDVRGRVPAVSPTMADAIARAVAAEPGARWPDGKAIANSLRAHDDLDPDPPALRPLQRVGGNWLVIAVPLTVIGVTLVPVTHEGGSWVGRLVGPPLLGFVLGATATLGRLVSLRSEHAPERPLRELLPAFLRPPRWWHAWWPRRWRGFDLVDHLPDEVAQPVRGLRLISSLMSLVMVLLPVCPLLLIKATPDELAGWMKGWQYGVIQAVMTWAVVPALLGVGGAARYARLAQQRLEQLGFTAKQAQLLLARTYDPEALRNADVAARLKAERPSAPAEPSSLSDLLGALAGEASAARAAGWPVDDLTPFVDEVRTADAQWARDAGELAADADPAEGARLRERLEKLRAGGTPRAGAPAEMAALLERQLELHERAVAQRHELEARRARLRDGCALIWRQLRALRADQARRLDPAELTGQVRALAADIARLRSSDPAA